jgi:hypothetical protein
MDGNVKEDVVEGLVQEDVEQGGTLLQCPQTVDDVQEELLKEVIRVELDQQSEEFRGHFAQVDLIVRPFDLPLQTTKTRKSSSG